MLPLVDANQLAMLFAQESCPRVHEKSSLLHDINAGAKILSQGNWGRGLNVPAVVDSSATKRKPQRNLSAMIPNQIIDI
jgi:hypothetical protein